ncbi:MAG: hypothetical protein J5932_02005 [Prevotella sp.]|nr:hypothetical protein [Prevotella sp.]
MCVNDNAEYDVTGVLNMYPRCVREGSPYLQRTLIGLISNTCVGITLLVNTQGCGRPQIADEQPSRYLRFLLCAINNKSLYGYQWL